MTPALNLPLARMRSARAGGTHLLLALTLGAALAACGSTEPRSESNPNASAAPATATAGPLPLIPMPASVEGRAGRFVLAASTPVRVQGDADARAAAENFLQLLSESTGSAPKLSAGKGRGIDFAIDPAAPAGDEAYALEIGDVGVRVRARTATGLFYGGVTLWQLATGNVASATRLPVTLPALRIQDAPRFAWRGFMLDSARHMQSVDQIKRVLDQMARLKLNTFHWHLTDDQGWRLQINKYPKLTEVGAWRIPAGKAGRDAQGQPVHYGGFYTQDQAREIVAYAQKLHITVVPEIEMPGHAQAAIAAYPQFGVTGKAPVVSPDWGVNVWLFNTDDAAFGFIEDVLTEVMDIFPGQFIHIGGDEADKYQWRNSARIQAQRRALGLKDDMAMQSWFVTRIEKFLVSKGRRLIGWDEILEGGLPPEATVMSWRGMEGAVEAARDGHDTVLTPSNVLYFNRKQSEAADEPPGHDYTTTLQAVYAFEPVPPELDAAQAKHVIGTQANLWTEYVRTGPRVEHLAFPRLAALSEVAWSPKASRDWDGFLHRMVPQMQRFAQAGIQAADSAFAVRFDASPGEGEAALVSLANQTSFGDLHYTTDGSAPSPQSPRYAAPVTVPFGNTLTANAFYNGQPLARARSLQVDAARLLTRDAEQLASCAKDASPMRQEDDEPLRPGGADDDRAVVPTTIDKPCWLWQQAPVRAGMVLRADLVDLPYNFQFGGDSAKPRVPSRRAATVKLQVFNGCEGKLLGEGLLARATPLADTPAIKRIKIPLKGTAEATDLCLRFSTPPDVAFWALDQAQLVPR